MAKQKLESAHFTSGDPISLESVYPRCGSLKSAGSNCIMIDMSVIKQTEVLMILPSGKANRRSHSATENHYGMI